MEFEKLFFRELDRPKVSGDYRLISDNYWLIDDDMNIFINSGEIPVCYESKKEAEENLKLLADATSVMYLHEAWLKYD